METLGLVVLVLVVAAVALVGFQVGDRRRRGASPTGAARPAPSVGEALRRAGPRGRVLVLFLGEDPASRDATRALNEEPALRAELARDGVEHVIVRAVGDDRDVASALCTKYGQADLPDGEPLGLLLDGAGALRRRAGPSQSGAAPEEWLLGLARDDGAVAGA